MPELKFNSVNQRTYRCNSYKEAESFGYIFFPDTIEIEPDSENKRKVLLTWRGYEPNPPTEYWEKSLIEQ